MNNQRFYEEFFLMYLFKVKEIKTDTMEPMFDKIDMQLVNNVISNRGNKTSPIHKGLLAYDGTRKILKITDDGISYIENKFSR